MQPLGKVDQLALANGTSTVKFPRGKLDLPKGLKMVALVLKCVVSLANSSGGAVTLTDAQKRTLLNLFQLTLNIGKDGKFSRPYTALGFNHVRKMARRALRSEIEGWSDTTTGLLNQLANSATETVTFYLPIPTGKWGALKGEYQNLWGVGRSMAELLELEIKQVGSTVLSGVVVTGTTTFDIIPYCVPCKGDHVSPLPVVEDQTETRKFVDYTEGLPLSIVETSAVQASATSTSVSLKVDGAEQYNQLPASEIILGHSDAADLPSAAQLTDEETLFYYLPVAGDVPMAEWPTGKPRLTQDVKDLATFSTQSLIVPLVPDGVITALVDYIAKEKREKKLKAVNAAAVYGLRVPKNMLPYCGFVMFDEDDAEFEQFAGIVAGPGMAPKFEIPKSMRERAEATIALHKEKGEDVVADEVVKTVAAQAPGAIQHTRGFGEMGSNILNTAQELLGRAIGRSR